MFNNYNLQTYSLSFHLDKNVRNKSEIHINVPNETLLVGKEILIDAAGAHPEVRTVATVREGYIALTAPLAYDHMTNALCIRVAPGA